MTPPQDVRLVGDAVITGPPRSGETR